MSTYQARKTAADRFGISTSKLLASTALVAAAMLPSIAQAGTLEANETWQFETGTDVNSTTTSLGHVRFDHTGSNRIIGNLVKEDICATCSVDINSALTVATGVEAGPMQLLGRLTSNGEVMVLDVSGFLFGSNSVVDTQGFAAIGGTLKNADSFLTDGKLDIDVAQDASITIEQGAMINVADAGLAAFVAPHISNSGIINARMGTVALAAGETVTLDLYGDGLVEVAVDGELANALIENKGTIAAEGGRVQMTALAAKDAVDNIINVEGVVTVASATQVGGKIVLSADNGNVVVDGTLDASGTDGGEISVDAQNTLTTAQSEIKADGNAEGQGGNITLWGRKNALYTGEISALGQNGFVETSGGRLGVHGDVKLSEGGEWLLDPTDITIVDGSGNAALFPPVNADVFFSPDDNGPDAVTANADSWVWIGDDNINAALDNGVNVTLQTHADGTRDGDITVRADADILKSAGAESTLRFEAHDDIVIDGTIGASGAAVLNLELIGDYDISGGNADIVINNTVSTNGGDFLATAPAEFVLTSAGSVNAGGGNINVDQGGMFISANADSLTTSGTGTIEINQNAGGSLQNAVNAIMNAGAGMNTINLSAGTFADSSQIVIDNNLTLIGAGKASTELNPDFDTGSSGNARGWFLVEAGKEFHVSNLTFDGNGQKVWQAIRVLGSGSADNVAFNDIKFNESGPNYAGTAIAAFGDGHFDVTNSMFSEIGRIGVQYFGTNGVSGSTYSGNMYTGKGAGDWLDYAVEVGGGAADIQIVDNNISNNAGVASVDGSTSAGVLITTFFGAGSSATISSNTFTDNTTGVFVGFNAADSSAVTFGAGNTITGGDYGLRLRGADVDIVGDTLSDIVFGGQSTTFVSLENGAEFAPGNPTVIDGTGVTWGTYGILPTGGDAIATEGMIQHYLDDSSLGLINFGAVVVGGATLGDSIQLAVNLAGNANIDSVVIPGRVDAYGGSVEVWVDDLKIEGVEIGGEQAKIDVATKDAFSNIGDVNDGFVVADSGVEGDGSDVTGVNIDPITFTGAGDGIVLGTGASSAIDTTIDGNSFTVSGVGVKLNNVGGTTEIINNNIDTGSKAVQINEKLDGDTLNIDGNVQVRGADDAIEFTKGVENAVVSISGNRGIIGDGSSNFGDAIDFRGLVSGSTVNIDRNGLIQGNDDAIQVIGGIVGGTFTIDGNREIRGQNGEGITLLDYASFGGDDINSIRGGAQVTISGNKIVGTQDGDTDNKGGTGDGVLVSGKVDGSTVKISGNDITGHDDGVNFNEGVTGSTIEVSGNTNITGTNGDGVRFGAASPSVSGSSVSITGNAIEGGVSGVNISNGELDNGSSINVDNNTKIAGGTGDGVIIHDTVAGGATVSVSGNLDVSAGDDGIDFKNLSGATADGNTIDNTGRHGVHVVDSENTGVLKNKIGTTGPAGNINGDGVLLVNSDGSNVKGNTITQTTSFANSFGNGIQVLSSDDVTIGGNGAQKNVITDVDWDGIRVVNADNITIRKNEITGVERTGIYGKNLTNSRLVRNKIADAARFHGIHLQNGDTVTVHRNRIDNVKKHGIVTDKTGVLTISRNNVDTTGWDGIHVKKSHGAVVKNNKVGTDADAGNIGQDGIHINGSNNAIVQGNTVNNAVANGILVNPSDNATIGGNTKEEGNTIADVGQHGIKIIGGTGHDVRNNNIRRAGWDGITVRDFGNAWIAYNDVKWTGDDGIHVEDGDFVSIYNNYIDLSGFLPNDSAPFPVNIEVGKDANGIYVDNVGGGELPPLATAEEGYGTSKYGFAVEIYGNDVANVEDDGIQVERSEEEVLKVALVEPEEPGDYTTYIADNIVGHVGDDGIDVDDYDITIARDNAVSLAGDKGITIDGGRYAGVFDNRVLLTGNDGIQVENVYGGQDAMILGDIEYGYGWSVNVSGNEVAMTGDDGIEVRYSGPTKVARNNVFMAGMGALTESEEVKRIVEEEGPILNNLQEVINTINVFASESGIPPYVLLSNAESFDWQWGNGHGINVHGIDGAYYSPNGWAADIRGNTVKYTGGHGILAEYNDRTRIKNNHVRFSGIDETTFYGAGSMMSMLNSGPFHRDNSGRRDLWKSEKLSMIDVLEGYIGNPEQEPEEPEYGRYITVEHAEFDNYDGIHAYGINGLSEEGRSRSNYLFDLKIVDNNVRFSGDDNIAALYSGRTLIARNRAQDAGISSYEYGDFYYNGGDYYGGDNIFAKGIVEDLYPSRRIRPITQNEDGSWNYEPRRNYALIIKDNVARRAADDNIEVVGRGSVSKFAVQGISGRCDEDCDTPPKKPHYGTTDRVLIAENRLRDAGYESDIEYKNQTPAEWDGPSNGNDGYGHDNIHVRGILGNRYKKPDQKQTPGGSYGSNGGFYGYAVDIIDNDARRAADDNIEVIESTSTLILDNKLRDAGYGSGYYYVSFAKGLSENGREDFDDGYYYYYTGADKYGADNIHVRNVGGNYEGYSNNDGKYAGDLLDPYAVVIAQNNARRAQDDNIEVVGQGWYDHGEGRYYGGTGRTLIEDNFLRRAGKGGSQYWNYEYGDGYGADNIHVRGVQNVFGYDEPPRDEETNPETIIAQSEFFGYGNGYDVQIINNNAKNAKDDNVEVIANEYGDTNILVELNELENARDTGIHILAQGPRPYYDDKDEDISRVTLVGPGYGEVNTDLFDNTVTNARRKGLHIDGYGHGDVVLEGNTFLNNPVGARFESGRIDLTGRTNSFIVEPDYVLPRRFDYVTGMQFELAGIGDPTILSIVDETLGTTSFTGFLGRPVGESFYVRFEDGAILDSEGNVIVIDGTNANWDGIVPSNFGNLLPPATLQDIEDRLWDADDPAVNGRGQIFVGNPLIGLDNIEDFFRQFNPFGSGFAGLNLTVLGLPPVNLPPGGLPGIAPFAGGEGDDVAGIEPAAGDDGDLANIEPAAGGEDVACWGDVLNAAVNGAVSYNFSGDPTESLADAASCGSQAL